MTPSQAFANFFACHKPEDAIKQLDRLVMIAMTTENGFYDQVEERDELYFFKENLAEFINAAYPLAEKQNSRFMQKAGLVVRGDGST